ncbi:NAD(P)-dependent oxidoreductase [Oceaniglobus ichthyenteri]|uniref:NAD(P)-dependent oxidoreductase n=1 Tax=Oceaniglobus ichthyenteri TaxID=2136177 RepID=UPI000D3D3702|nr:NAD(P)-dependent oxidoreductase [Oceaniglobus ichthyenteri]
MTKIGFIGLGLMGAAMVQRLQDRGHALTVLGNKTRTRIDEAVKNGATEAKTARELAAASDIVMLCMGTSEQVESRMLGDDGVIAGMKPGTVVIDFGTSLPSSTVMLGEKVAAAGGTYLDTPLGRTPDHAYEGKLNIMGAGDKAAFDKVKPVLDDLGENVFHLGKLGSGHTVKLMNNFFGMTVANAMAEAFAMADKMGVERKMFYDVVSAGPLHSGMMDFVAAYALEGDTSKLAFAVGNAKKDVGYYAQMASDAGVESMMSASANSAMAKAVDAGYSDKMVCEMVDFYADKFK